MRHQLLILTAALLACRTTTGHADQPAKTTIVTPAGTVVVSSKSGHSVEKVLQAALAEVRSRKQTTARRLSILEAKIDALRKEVAGLQKSATITQLRKPTDVPTLLEPKPGVVMPNGTDRFDSTVTWDFRWMPVSGADKYQLAVFKRHKDRPSIETFVGKTTYRHVQAGIWSSGSSYLWRVRAFKDGKPLPWSDFRVFDVKPVRVADAAAKK